MIKMMIKIINLKDEDDDFDHRSSLRELSLSGLGGLGSLPPIEPSAVKVFHEW